MPRVIVANRIPRVPIASRSIAVAPAAASGGASGVGDISFWPVGFKFPLAALAANTLNTVSTSSPQVNVTQTAHGYSVGQQVVLAGVSQSGAMIAGTPLNGQFAVTVASIIDANNWSFTWNQNAGVVGSFGGAFMSAQNLAPLSTPTAPGAVYQDALVQPASMFRVSDYSALFAMQGPISGRTTIQNAQTVAAAISGFALRWSVVWKGQIYSAASTGALRKRATSMAAVPGSDTIAAPSPAASMGLLPTPNYLVQVMYSSPNTSLRVISGADVPSASINVGSQWDGVTSWGHTAFETGTGTLIVLLCNPGPILRTTNGGGAWTGITSNLSTPAVRIWTCIWKSGSNLYMLSQQQALATSTDDGVTWTVNSAIPGATGLIGCASDGNREAYSLVALDQPTRRGYAVNNSGQMLTWDMDNPTAGFTIDMAAGYWVAPTNMRLVSNSYGLMGFSGLGAALRSGIWARKRGTTGAFTQVASIAQLPSDQSNLQTYMVAGALLDLGDGLLSFDHSDTGPGASPFSFQIADFVNTFDRYILPVDPYLLSGRRPFIRVL